MFKKTRIKIVMAIMSIQVLILVGTLCLIYYTSYIDTYNTNQQLLDRYVETYLQIADSEQNIQNYFQREDSEQNEQNFFPRGNWYQNEESTSQEDSEQGNRNSSTRENRNRNIWSRLTNFGAPSWIQNNIYGLSTFYSVLFSETGEVVHIYNNNNIYSDEQLTSLAKSIIEKGKHDGAIENLSYKLALDEDYTLVAFMDNTVTEESQTTLLKYTIIFGIIVIIVIFFISIYLSKKIVQPIEQSYKKQKQFISDAGHELKTPVSVINTNSDILSREIGENQWLSNIQYENNKMASLINQLMELAKTENTFAAKEQIDFSRLVMGELLTFDSVIFDKGMKLSETSIEEDVFVYGNIDWLRQLVSILLDNAIEHSIPEGNIEVELSVVHNKARLNVINEGEEIPKEQRKLIFERFYRRDASRNDNGNHYGLGLAIAKSIVEAHHGDIAVSCGKGQVAFTVTIPVKK